jgi:hypothetical protein
MAIVMCALASVDPLATTLAIHSGTRKMPRYCSTTTAALSSAAGRCGRLDGPACYLFALARVPTALLAREPTRETPSRGLSELAFASYGLRAQNLRHGPQGRFECPLRPGVGEGGMFPRKENPPFRLD